MFVGYIRVGIHVPTIEVRFEHLNVEAEAYVGSRALPTFFNYSVNMLEVRTSPYRPLVVIAICSFIDFWYQLVLTCISSFLFKGCLELSPYSFK